MKFILSPNYTKGRKGGIKPTYIVLHAMSGSFQGSKTWFLNPASKVSAHYLISKKGEILQMVDEANTAWHCYGLNSKSIGIEHEDGKPGECLKNSKWLTKEMLQSSVKLSAQICIKYGISTQHIVGHNAPWIQKLGGPKGYAHKDPGPYFNINDYRVAVEKEISNLKGLDKEKII